MTPEQAADDEYCEEVRLLDTYTVMERSGNSLVPVPVYSATEVDAARVEALASPERTAYVQERSEEIRAERAKDGMP